MCVCVKEIGKEREEAIEHVTRTQGLPLAIYEAILQPKYLIRVIYYRPLGGNSHEKQ